MKAQEILDDLSSSDIVLEIAVIVLVQEPGRQALRAIASLKGGYVLHINESHGRDFRSYSYHVGKATKWCKDGTMHPTGQILRPSRIIFISAVKRMHLSAEKFSLGMF